MGETSVFWLRVTLGLYSLGLLHALLTVVRRRQRLFRLALASFCVGAVFQVVSIVEEGLALGRFPVANLHQSASLIGFCITLLGLMTEWGVTTEELAKWHELDVVLMRWFGIHINPQIADAFGLKILIAGVVATAVGFGLARSSSKK